MCYNQAGFISSERVVNVSRSIHIVFYNNETKGRKARTMLSNETEKHFNKIWYLWQVFDLMVKMLVGMTTYQVGILLLLALALRSSFLPVWTQGSSGNDWKNLAPSTPGWVSGFQLRPHSCCRHVEGKPVDKCMHMYMKKAEILQEICL